MNNLNQNTQLSVLVVEDDAVLLEIFAYAFQLAGFQITTCQEGEEAKQLLLEKTPDVVLLDLHLPKASGEDLITFIENDYGHPDIITVLATGDSRRASFLQNRVNYVFLKPVSFTQIKQLATRILREAQLKKQEDKKPTKPFNRDNDTGPISSLPTV